MFKMDILTCDNDHGVAFLSKLYLAAVGIILRRLKSIGQF